MLWEGQPMRKKGEEIVFSFAIGQPKSGTCKTAEHMGFGCVFL
jgi:hypothetical protein